VVVAARWPRGTSCWHRMLQRNGVGTLQMRLLFNGVGTLRMRTLHTMTLRMSVLFIMPAATMLEVCDRARCSLRLRASTASHDGLVVWQPLSARRDEGYRSSPRQILPATSTCNSLWKQPQAPECAGCTQKGVCNGRSARGVNSRQRSPLVAVQMPSAQASVQQHQRARPVAPFVQGGTTISKQAIGNIYDGRYNRSRLLKPGPATIRSHVLWMDDSGAAAWLPVTQDQSYSRCPVHVEPMAASEVFTEASLETHVGPGNGTALSVRGDMYSTQGWKSAASAAYLYDQMT
jgi:hypothetical protein